MTCHGFVWTTVTDDRLNSAHFSGRKSTFLLAEIDNEPLIKEGQMKFTARIRSIRFSGQDSPATGRILIFIKDPENSYQHIAYGQLFWMPARYTVTLPPSNPGMFNYKKWLSRQQVFHQASLQQAEFCLLPQLAGNRLIRFALNWRKNQVKLYRKLLRDPGALSVASTLILGYRSTMDQQLINTYSRTGTIHVLSVSGMHVGLVYLLLNWMLYRLNTSLSRKILKLLIILSLIWCYVLITGYSPSVIRAAVMLSLFLVADISGKPSTYKNLIYLAAFGMLHYEPRWLWDIGFQLSFLSVAGILYLHPVILRCIDWRSISLQKIWELISLSFAAQIFTTPLSIYYFHFFPLTFIISNLFITIPVTLIMYSGILVLIFPIQWLAALLEWLIILLNNGLFRITQLPYPVLDRLWPDEFQVLLLYLILLLIFIPLKASARFLSLAILTLIFQFTLTYNRMRILRQHQILYFRSSGHIIPAIVYRDRAAIISDTRPPYATIRFYILPALDSMGIRQIRYIKPILP